MTTPAADTASSSAAGQWWVIAISARGSPATHSTVQAATRPPNTASQSTVAGPFATQADAQAWIQTNFGGAGLGFLPSIPNPFGFLAALGWIQEIGHWLGIFISAVTDLHTWISIGWLALGFWMLVIGILLWLRIPQRAAKAAKDAGEAAAAAAVVA